MYSTSGLVDPQLMFKTMKSHPEINIGEALARVKVRQSMEAKFEGVRNQFEGDVAAFNKKNLEHPWFKDDYLKFTFGFDLTDESPASWQNWQNNYVNPNSLDSLLHGAYELARRLGSSPFERLAVWKTKSQPGLLVSGCGPVGDVPSTFEKHSWNVIHLDWSCTLSILPSHYKEAHQIIKNFIKELHEHVIDAQKDLEKKKLALSRFMQEQLALNQRFHQFCVVHQTQENESGQATAYGIFWEGIVTSTGSEGFMPQYNEILQIMPTTFKSNVGEEARRLMAQAKICAFEGNPFFGKCRLSNNAGSWAVFLGDVAIVGKFATADEGLNTMVNTPECLK